MTTKTVSNGNVNKLDKQYKYDILFVSTFGGLWFCVWHFCYVRLDNPRLGDKIAWHRPKKKTEALEDFSNDFWLPDKKCGSSQKLNSQITFDWRHVTHIQSKNDRKKRKSSNVEVEVVNWTQYVRSHSHINSYNT